MTNVRHYEDKMPSITLDFRQSKYLDPRVKARRATSGTGVVDGILTTFPIDTARLTDKGLLVEESRTNFCLHSDIDPTNWTQAGTLSLAVSSVPAPDGGTCYDLTTDDGGANSEILTEFINNQLAGQ